MEQQLIWETLGIGLLIFLARVVDVSLGTIRTISTVHGRGKTAFILGAFEVSIWLLVVSKMISEISNQPIYVLFYALGFSTGNVLGILVERRIAFGYVGLRVFCRQKGDEMADAMRDAGYAVTSFEGKGKSGTVVELYAVCKRKKLNELVAISRKIEPDAFYTSDHVATVRQTLQTVSRQPTGWRAIMKRK
jgi:uncharacterized protein YebE (UPF0316 family)